MSKSYKVEKRCEECGATFKIYRCKVRGGRGKFCSKDCKNLHHSKSMKGCHHPNWKGGKSDERNTVQSSKEYKEWRYKVYLNDNFTCQKCNKKSEGDIVAHHIAAFSRYPALRVVPENGVTLCNKCHNEFHNLYGKLKFEPQDTWDFLKGELNEYLG